MRSHSVLLTAALAISFMAVAAQEDVPPINWKSETGFIGCFEASGVKKYGMSEVELVTRGTCRDDCKAQGTRYAAITNGDTCYCGDGLPDENFLTDYHKCDIGCFTFAADSCGGVGYYYIYLVDPALRDPRKWDWKKNPEHDPNEEPSTTGGPSETTTTTGSPPIVTVTPSTSPSNAPSDENKGDGDSGINKAGAAAGAVVGIVLVISLGVGAFLYFRKQKRRKVEEEYRRSVAVREFAKKPEPDLRLDPVMLHRRLSDGSIADNQDYSRRILKVTNPDGN